MYIVEGGIACGKSSALRWAQEHGRRIFCLPEPSGEWAALLDELYRNKKSGDKNAEAVALVRLQLKVLVSLHLRWKVVQNLLQGEPDSVAIVERSIDSGLGFLYCNSDTMKEGDMEALESLCRALKSVEEGLPRILMTCDDESSRQRSEARGDGIDPEYLRKTRLAFEARYANAAHKIDTTGMTVEQAGKKLLEIARTEEAMDVDEGDYGGRATLKLSEMVNGGIQ